MQVLIHAAITARARGLAAVRAQIAAPLIQAFRHGDILGLGQIKRATDRKQQPCSDFLECLHDQEHDVLRFARDLRIPLTSNQAGRDLRPAKTLQ
jgi:transposase